MVTLIRVAVAVFVGVLLGLLITIYSLDQANRSVLLGPWHGAARDGSAEIDPYALAGNARSSLLPLGAAEGLSFIADADTKGRGLSNRCDYTVTGPLPPARFWTMSVLTPDGFPIANPASRYSYTSSDVLRLTGEPVVLNLSADAKSGNWLPTGQTKHYVLMLRLYDTGLSTVGTVLKADAMPTIRRIACR